MRQVDIRLIRLAVDVQSAMNLQGNILMDAPNHKDLDELSMMSKMNLFGLSTLILFKRHELNILVLNFIYDYLFIVSIYFIFLKHEYIGLYMKIILPFHTIEFI